MSVKFCQSICIKILPSEADFSVSPTVTLPLCLRGLVGQLPGLLILDIDNIVFESECCNTKMVKFQNVFEFRYHNSILTNNLLKTTLLTHWIPSYIKCNNYVLYTRIIDRQWNLSKSSFLGNKRVRLAGPWLNKDILTKISYIGTVF